MSSPTLLSKLWELRSPLLAWFMFGLIALSVTATYYKTMVIRDFVIIDDLEETLDE